MARLSSTQRFTLLTAAPEIHLRHAMALLPNRPHEIQSLALRPIRRSQSRQRPSRLLPQRRKQSHPKTNTLPPPQLTTPPPQAQYGNILRLTPSGESPLLLPANEHKRLIVIDFEYANANPPGLEFANHFSEWCYDYHDETAPHACRTALYPTTEEQARFVKAYVTHRPRLSESSAPSTPFLAGRAYQDVEAVMLAPPAVAVTEKERSGTGMVTGFVTDMRTPAAVAAREAPSA